MRRESGWTLAMVLLLAFVATADAGERRKHTGFISSIGRDSTFVLSEVGPWSTRNGVTVVTQLTITLVDETEYAIAARAEDAGTAFPGAFVETPVGPERVYLNDYVTVDCRHEGTRLVAVKVTVTQLPAGGTGSAR